MAEQKLPSYVIKIDSSGRRFFKPEFVEILVNDIRTNKTTVKKACEDFNLRDTLVYRWMRGEGGGTPGGAKANTSKTKALKAKMNGHSSLLDLAADYDRKHAAREVSDAWDINPTHVNLAVRYCRGEISSDAVNFALRKAGLATGKTRVMRSAWLGAVVRWALAHGYDLKRR